MQTSPRRSTPGRTTQYRIALALALIVSLLLIPNRIFLVRGETWATPQGRSQDHRRDGHPKPGKPEATLPNLDTIRNQRPVERELPAPIPSTMRSKKIPLQPWDGRRVGEEHLPPRNVNNEEPRGNDGGMSSVAKRESNRHTKRAHAGRRFKPSSPPPVYDDTFIDDFYTNALPGYTPLGNEKPYWRDQMRVGLAQGQTSLVLAATEMGRTLFESATYAVRARNDSEYVWDLYRTYLMRDANYDQSGWNFWTGVVGLYGREDVRRSFEESVEFATLMSNIVPNGSASSNAISFVASRVDPRTQPGNGLLTRDVSWSESLLSLPGRAGLDLGLTLSYSSQVWTKSGPFIYFDEDNGFPSAGFRLGFPIVQRKTFDAQTATNSYLLITPGGQRVELRQVGTSNIYEAADSSYLQLTENGSSWLVRSTDGTQLTFTEQNNEYHCSQIKDRNGNYITVNYDGWGHITTITDTLGRVITFNYDTNHNLQTITQTWNGATHTWATFGWTTKTLSLVFSDVAVIGARDGGTVPVINQVAINDGSYYQFDYQSYGQVNAIKRYHVADSPAILRFQNWFSYASPGSDAARLENSSLNVYNWTGINGIPGNVTTTYGVAGNTCFMTAPDGTYLKETYGTGWQSGLTMSSEIWSGGVKQKWIDTIWTQDNTSVGYQTNPRVTETNIYDKDGNRKRTTIDYWSTFGLPHVIADYAADGTNALRYTNYDYHNESDYVNRRIIGLPFRVDIKDGSWNVKARTEYTYDWSGSDIFQDTPAAATQHDRTNYGPSFVVGRGNLSMVQRYDVNDLNNSNNTALETKYRVNSTGSVLMIRDPLWHQKFIAYGDSFADSVNRNTFAYPTTLTDEDGNNSYVQYNFDFGATTRTQGPPPAGQSQGLIQTMSYYSTTGHLERTTTTNNGAYKRFVYGPDSLHTFATVNNAWDDSYSFQYFDALGRVIAAGGIHPGSTGGYKVQETQYDIMGRVKQVSNPTEINSSWSPAGDDTGGWLYTQQSYDWKGRPLVTTNPDATTKTVEYSGCGCAGGEIVTLTDEGTTFGVEPNLITKKRQQKIYSDVLGRTVKSENFNWDGSGPFGTTPNNTVYAAIVSAYNTLDQVTQVRQYAGDESSSTYQETTITYDGFGRIKTKHSPDQAPNTFTSWSYNADSTLSLITDPRGATSTFTYNNNRGLVNTATYALSGNPTTALSYAYDGAGNRTSMSDSSGTTTYTYNSLSQMTTETRQFSGIAGQNFTLSYDYNYLGEVKSFTLPSSFGTSVGYQFDNAGRLSAVTGSGYSYTDPSNYQQRIEIPISSFLSGISYRAWGDLKDMDGGGAHTHFNYDANLAPSSYSLTNTSSTLTWNYAYHPDGNLRLASDLANNHFDRRYEFDHVGRLTESYTGNEARGGSPSSPIPDSPYRETNVFDVFGNLRQQTGRVWQKNLSADLFSYSNNRRNDLGYDAAGNVVSDLQGSHVFDARGQRVLVTAGDVGGGQTGHPNMPAEEVATVYAGDGKPANVATTVRDETLINGGPQTDIYTTNTLIFYLRSTVLNAVVAELTTQGQRSAEYIYGGGEQIAKWNISPWNDGMEWQHKNAMTGSWVVGWAGSGGNVGRVEVDPNGRNTGTEPFFIPPDPPEPAETRDQTYYLIEGGPTIEARLGMQLYEDRYINKVFGSGSGPNQGNYSGQPWQDWQTSREFQITTGQSFIFGMDGMDSNIPGNTYEWVSNLVDYDDGSPITHDQDGNPIVPALAQADLGYYRLSPGATVQTKTKPSPVKSEPWVEPPDGKAIRGNLEIMMRTGGCGEFLKELITRLNSKTNPMISDNPLDLFDKVIAGKGGLVRGGLATKEKVSAITDGHIGNGSKPGNATIYLGDHFTIGGASTTHAYKADAVSKLDAQNVLHELVHQAGSKDHYTDAQVSQVLSNWLGVPGLPKRRDYKTKAEFIGANSSYYQAILASRCPGLP